MEHIEQLALSTFLNPPTLWCRYVDNTVCILNKQHTNNFHGHLNSISNHIQFTTEEVSEPLPFLDVLVSRRNNVISTQIYKKPTHPEQYLPYSSNHPKHQKLAITHSYFTQQNFFSYHRFYGAP